jgi:hypothetical protein
MSAKTSTAGLASANLPATILASAFQRHRAGHDDLGFFERDNAEEKSDAGRDREL